MARSERGKAAIVGGIAMMIGAFIAGGILTASLQTSFFRIISDAFLSSPLTAPIDTSLPLTSGEWAIYVADGTVALQSGGVNGVQAAAAIGEGIAVTPATLNIFDIAITGPSGQQLALEDATTTTQNRITRNNTSYLAELKFRVPANGDYHFVVSGNDGTALFVAPTFSGFANLIPFGRLGGIVFCIFTFFIGLIVLIVGLVQHSRASTPAVAAVGFEWPVANAAQYQQVPVPVPVPELPPPGWYSDPMRNATWRYWDGQVWTDHIG
jgi:hypothetical protein